MKKERRFKKIARPQIERGMKLIYEKPKRNEPCFCKSGKKYKKCHGRS